MGDEVRWRREFARELVAALPPLHDLRAAFIAGSAAREYSDRYSDIELIFCWERPPTPADRLAIRDRWGAVRRLPPGDRAYESALLVRGVPVDLWQRSVAEEDEALDRVLLEHSLDLVAQAELELVRTAVPLRGAELIERWRARAAYPEALALGFLRELLPDFSLRQLSLAAVRDNPTEFYHHLASRHRTLFLVLLALNGAYFPTFKWLYRRRDTLPIAPPGVGARLRQQFVAPPPVATALLRGLLLETLALVKERYPRFDPEVLTRARHDVALAEARRIVRP